MSVIHPKKTYKHKVIFLFLILLTSNAFSINCRKEKTDSLFKAAKQLIYTQYDSALIIVGDCLSEYSAIKDTMGIIQTKLVLINQYSGKGNYQDAYDMAWSLLSLVEKPKYLNEKLELYYQLAILYILFEKYDKAYKYKDEAVQSIAINIKDEKQRILLKIKWNGLEAWLIESDTKAYTKIEQLLKENILLGEQHNIDSIWICYSKLQLADLYLKTNRLELANKLLFNVHNHFKDGVHPIHSLLYHYLGNYYFKKQDLKIATQYYEECLISIDRFKNHLDKKIITLELLSDCYEKMGNPIQALKDLKEAKYLNDKLFGSTSSQNKTLFEIKDSYNARIQSKKEKLRSQKILLLEREQQLALYKFFMIIGFALIILCLMCIYIYCQSRKFKNKHKQLKNDQDLDKKKQEAELELKNKELLASALKLIERDNLLDEIEKALKLKNEVNFNGKSINEICRLIQINKSKSWDEFETHFIAINDSFYNNLKKQFPELTPTELRMCAFVKLGFSSKEISSTMSIGVKGINTTRYRIRKKMSLPRDTNFTEFLQTYSQ